MRLKYGISLGLIILALGCAKGANIVACVVDSASHGFQCSENGERQFFLTLDSGKDLQCTSPAEIEIFLKACKQGTVVEVSLCRFQIEDQYICKDPLGKESSLHFGEMDNYFCLSEQHRQRVIDRCKNQ